MPILGVGGHAPEPGVLVRRPGVAVFDELDRGRVAIVSPQLRLRYPCAFGTAACREQ
ncbi:MAG: hypothetical protein IH809_04035 [Proteobacteria bacterium]|nr:hypothetical protein [Pseudomonadota bacterium]